jgi:hypothetical protein
MIKDEIRQVRTDLRYWALSKPDEIRFLATIIVENLHRLEHWPDDRPMLFETRRNVAALEWARSEHRRHVGTGAQLILKRSSLAHAGFDDFDVLCEGELVGRIYFIGDTSPRARAWLWALAYTARIAARRMATRRAARRRWRHSPRAGGGNNYVRGAAVGPRNNRC